MNITLDSNTTGATTTDATSRSKLADAAQQFEAMMLQELLKPLRSSEDDLSGEKSEDSSFDTLASFGTESVAKSIAQHGGLGIARQVIRHLSAHVKDESSNHAKEMPIRY
jgi:Rod binding domain-containing protein